MMRYAALLVTCVLLIAGCAPGRTQKLRQLEQDVVAAQKELETSKNKNAALGLLGAYEGLARALAEARDVERLVEVLYRGQQVEREQGLAGSECSAISYLHGHLIDEWIHKDGEMLLRYLRSRNVSLEDKKGAMQYLQEVIEKEYPGRQPEKK